MACTSVYPSNDHTYRLNGKLSPSGYKCVPVGYSTSQPEAKASIGNLTPLTEMNSDRSPSGEPVKYSTLQPEAKAFTIGNLTPMSETSTLASSTSTTISTPEGVSEEVQINEYGKVPVGNSTLMTEWRSSQVDQTSPSWRQTGIPLIIGIGMPRATVGVGRDGPLQEVPFNQCQRPAVIPGHKLLANVFRPMRVVGGLQVDRDILSVLADEHFSTNYKGERSERNRSADIPDSENCSLWLTNLPPALTHHQLLSQIHNAGRIYATVINPPDQHVGHQTSAAKLVFFSPASARAFYLRAHTCGFFVGGLRTRVGWNRIKSARQEISGRRSRVLIITGDDSFVNERTLTGWFRERFSFETDSIQTLYRQAAHVILEYRFGSYRCQAESARMALSRERPTEVVKVEWGEDPCA